jgi:hypothetical protein
MGLPVAEGSCVFCTWKNEAEFSVEMIIHFSEFNDVGNRASGYFGVSRIVRKIKLSTHRIMEVVSSIRSQT